MSEESPIYAAGQKAHLPGCPGVGAEWGGPACRCDALAVAALQRIAARPGGSLPPGDIREQLAAYAHAAWSGWMDYLFSKSYRDADGYVHIPAALVARWTRQMTTPYADLPEAEKASDRAEADKMWALMQGGT